MVRKTTHTRRRYLKAMSAAALAAPAAGVAVDNARALYNPRVIMNEGIADRVSDYESGINDLGIWEAYMSGVIYTAEANDIPLTLMDISNGGSYIERNRDEFNSVEEFETSIHHQLFWDDIEENTIERSWSNAQPGDVLVYDYERTSALYDDPNYFGNVRVIVDRDCDEFTVVQGKDTYELERRVLTKEELQHDNVGKPRQLDWEFVLGTTGDDIGWDSGGYAGVGCDDGSDPWEDDDDGWDDDDSGGSDDGGSDGDGGWSIPGFTLPAVGTGLAGGALYKRFSDEKNDE